jgi:hypothetical protein
MELTTKIALEQLEFYQGQKERHVPSVGTSRASLLLISVLHGPVDTYMAVTQNEGCQS